MLIKVRQFLTKKDENPVPLRTMRVVETKRETAKAVLVVLQGTPLPTGECVHCGREITHPQSLHFGIGSTCIKQYPQLLAAVDYDDIETSYKELQTRMQSITWEGWLPKGHIEMIEEAPNGWDIVFTHSGKTYHVQTKDAHKVAHIHENAESIVSYKEMAL